MHLDQLHAFLALHRHGTFTAAAADLHLSQPAMSRRVALLERELGAPLFERTPTHVILTEPGHALLAHAEAMIAAERDAAAAVTEVLDGRAGGVTLAVVGTLASTRFGRALAAFRAARPGVDLRLRTALSAGVSDLVRRGEATVGLRYEADPDLDSTVVHHERLVAICAPDHPLATAQVTAAALARQRWLGFPARAGEPRETFTAVLARYAAAHGLDGAETVPIDSLTAQKRLVEAGFGLAFVPVTAVEEERAAGTLRVLDLPVPAPGIPVALVRRPGAFVSAATRTLVDVLTGDRPAPRG